MGQGGCVKKTKGKKGKKPPAGGRPIMEEWFEDIDLNNGWQARSRLLRGLLLKEEDRDRGKVHTITPRSSIV